MLCWEPVRLQGGLSSFTHHHLCIWRSTLLCSRQKVLQNTQVERWLSSQKTQPQTHRAPTSQKMGKQNLAAAGTRVLPAEEENPRLKCKNCGAFGHMASSTRCPIKRWDGTLALYPLNSKVQNLGPQKIQQSKDSRPFTKTLQDKEGHRQQEKLCRTPLQTCLTKVQARQQHHRENATDSSENLLSTPRRLVPVQTNKKTSVTNPVLQAQSEERSQVPASPVPQEASRMQGPPQSFQSHAPVSCPAGQTRAKPQDPARTMRPHSTLGSIVEGKRSARWPRASWQTGPKRPRLAATVPVPQNAGSNKEPATLQTQQPLPLPATAGLGRKAAWHAIRSSPNPELSARLQPPSNRPQLKPSQDCTGSHPPSPASAPHPQSLKMLLSRLHGNRWSCRIISTPSSHPPEEAVPQTLKTPGAEGIVGSCSKSPLSVLYEDLQVSSSSEDTDQED